MTSSHDERYHKKVHSRYKRKMKRINRRREYSHACGLCGRDIRECEHPAEEGR